ncbi:MAG: hypothetical protein DLM60_23840 [Pseudonocardiales bacterium]|nr:MAG: hypothetical protein DLM60_23840 [Pseudonocardiales bacterium]
MTASSPAFDVGVIGDGPAGGSLTAYLARAGIDCVVPEWAIFPPAPCRGVPGPRVDPRVPLHDGGGEVPRKYRAIWTANAPSPIYELDWEGLQTNSSADIDFAERAQEGVDQNYTYHVDRGLFDNLLLHHAHRVDAKVYEGVAVKGVDFSEPGHVTEVGAIPGICGTTCWGTSPRTRSHRPRSVPDATVDYPLR